MDLEKVLYAVQQQQNFSTSQQERHSAYLYCEEFKSKPESCIAIVTTVLNTDQKFPDHLVHFGLHCAEQLICYNWSNHQTNDQSQLHSLKHLCLSLASNAYTFASKSNYLLEKVGEISAQMVLREWPQDWPSFHTDLLSLIQPSDGNLFHNEHNRLIIKLILIIIRNLCSYMIDGGTSTKLPERRKREVQDALTIILEENFFSLIQQVLIDCSVLTNEQDDINFIQQMIKLSLQTLNSLAPWSKPQLFYRSTMLQLIYPLMMNNNLCVYACQLCSHLSKKKLTDPSEEDQKQMITMLISVLNLTKEILNLPKENFIDEHIQHLLSILIETINSFLHIQNMLFIDQSNTIQQNSIDTVMYECLIKLLSKVDNYDILLHVISTWTHLFQKGPQCMPNFIKEYSIDLIRTVLPYSFQFIQKRLATSIQCDEEDEGNLQTASQYRTEAIALVSAMCSINYGICIEFIGMHLVQAITQPLDNNEIYMTETKYMSVSSPRYLSLDGLTTMLDTCFRVCINKNKQNNNISIIESDPNSFRDFIHQLISRTDNNMFTDPLLTHAYIKMYSSFGFALDLIPELTLHLVQKCFTFVKYRSPEERNNNLDQLSLDVKSTRKRAAFTLLSLGKDNPKAFLPHLIFIYQTLEQLSFELLREEIMHINQFMIYVGIYLPSSDRSELMGYMMKQSVINLNDNMFLNKIKSGELLFGLCDCIAFDVNKIFDGGSSTYKCGQYSHVPTVDNYLFNGVSNNHRSQLLYDLNICSCVLKEYEKVIDVSTCEYNMLNSITRSLYIILISFYTMHSPQVYHNIPIQRRPLFAHNRSHMRFLDHGNKQGIGNVNETVHNWIYEIHGHLMNLLQYQLKNNSNMNNQQDDNNILQLVNNNILSYIPSAFLRKFISELLISYILTCPIEKWTSELSLFLKECLTSLDQRLVEAWESKEKADTKSQGNIELDIILEAEVRDLTRAYISMIRKIFEQMPRIEDFVTFLLNICVENVYMILRTLARCLLWDDNVCKNKAIDLLTKLVSVFCQSESVAAALRDSVLPVCLQVLSICKPRNMDNFHMSAILLIQEMHCLVGPYSNIIRVALCQMLDASPQEIQQLDSLLEQKAAKKKKKTVMKEFLLAKVIGRNTVKSDKAIVNKEEKFKPIKASKQSEPVSMSGVAEMFAQ